ncbi:MAG: effector binding domain-containing protein [Dehalococcoidales bacterium]|jgi:AraC family transcriptional regulator
MIQTVLDIIDNRITERLTPPGLAGEIGYSAFHFNRKFSRAAGITLMAYITRRKLQYALYDLSCGEKIIDVAVKYGFETHAGFTKAFKKCFGYPPSLYRIHAITSRPTRMELPELKSMITGGKLMQQEIVELKPFTVVGFPGRHKMPNVKFTHDIPLYWETINLDYADDLTRLHNLFNKSRHTEYAVCYDINPETSEFTYLLGVGVDNPEDLVTKESDMHEMKMPGGTYAKFTTPLVAEEKYSQTVRDMWKKIFDSWLPASGYAFDEKRYDFEYYDERDHPWENKGMAQMDIYIPLKKH